MTKLEEFEKCLNELTALREKKRTKGNAYQNMILKKAMAIWRSLRPRKKYDNGKFMQLEEAKPLLAEISNVSRRYMKHWNDLLGVKTAGLMNLALLSEIPKGENYQLYSTHWTSTYSSQGYGASKYAAARANIEEQWLSEQGLDTTIETVYGHDHQPVECRVMVKTTALGVLLLRYRPYLSKVEFVRRCWAMQVQPRVFDPFIPPDFEKDNGLDFWGGFRKLEP